MVPHPCYKLKYVLSACVKLKHGTPSAVFPPHVFHSLYLFSNYVLFIFCLFLPNLLLSFRRSCLAGLFLHQWFYKRFQKLKYQTKLDSQRSWQSCPWPDSILLLCSKLFYSLLFCLPLAASVARIIPMLSTPIG